MARGLLRAAAICGRPRLTARVIAVLTGLAACAASVTAARPADATGGPAGFLAQAPPVMQPLGHRASDGTRLLCGRKEWEWLPSGLVAYNDVLTRTDSECMDITGPDSFRVIKSTTPRYLWNAYPDLFLGCQYDVCSHDTALPVRVSRIRSLRMTLWTRYPASALGNDATDWWFTRSDPGRSRRQPDGAELMLWLTERGVPASGAHRHEIGGRRYLVLTWVVHRNGTSWNYIQIRLTGHRHNPSVTRFNMLAIIRWCEARHLIRPYWWASSFDAGYELIKHGRGISTERYALTLTKSG
ncbi:MAG TPA: hypothetical protein VMR00_08860 [Streptosporangiaceae bacterium]|nr:hypothetical protein [Streptosporangiaceae bacterium]